MPVQCCVVQGRAPASVRDINTAQQWDDHLGTFDSLIGCRHVEGGLPVLVPRVDVGRMFDQHLHRLLQQKQSVESLANAR